MARVALIDIVKADANRIALAVEAADLPPGRVRLLVGDPKLSSEFQAVTIPRAFVHSAGNLYGLEDHLREAWDCGVIIGEKWAAKEEEFPAYFSYLLAHELGHTKTALTNLALTLYEDLILKGVPHVAAGRQWRWDDMPHEIRYDQFGIAVAEEIHGRAKVEAEFEEIIKRGLTSDEPRLRKVLGLTPRKDLHGLREDLAEFSRPYRPELVRLWSEARAAGTLRIADGLEDLEALWNFDLDDEKQPA